MRAHGEVTGVAERGDPVIYVCYDNEAYQNTGNQRSGSIPYGAFSMTTPTGKNADGKRRFRKDMPRIVASSGAAYVATASIAYLNDYVRKIRRAEEVTKNDEGMAYIHIQSPCPTGWRFPSSDTIKLARLAVQSGIWQLYEIYGGEFKRNLVPREKVPISEYLGLQRRFSHLTEEQVETIQRHVEESWSE